MDYRDKRFWLPILASIPIQILINLITQFSAIPISVVILVIISLIVIYFFFSNKIANWRAERNRQSRVKAAGQLQQEIDELEKLRGDLAKLISRIALDLLTLQVIIAIVALLTVIVVFVLPSDLRQFVPSVLIGFIIALLLQLKDLRYINRIYKFEAYRNEVKSKLAELNEPDWSGQLVSCHWVLVHGPPNQSKPITFLRDGKVGEGQNQNEHTWRIRNGKLELLNRDGHVFSRFGFDKTTTRFNHTNDADTLSNRDQYIFLQVT